MQGIELFPEGRVHGDALPDAFRPLFDQPSLALEGRVPEGSEKQEVGQNGGCQAEQPNEPSEDGVRRTHFSDCPAPEGEAADDTTKAPSAHSDRVSGAQIGEISR